MYQDIIHSDNRPFRSTPDARFYFAHSSIENARQSVARAITRAEGPAMVLGAAGLGKSLLGEIVARDLGSQFDLVKLHAARLCSRRALLQNILFELQMPYRDLSEGELRLSLLDRLEPGEHCKPQGALLIVDEAHTLPEKLLEELRLITNFTRNQQPRARLVLLGGMKLEDTFSRPTMESFNQRLATRCYLSPMTRAETRGYVDHQLTVAELDARQVITEDAREAVYAASEGVPRLANQIMDHSVVLGLTREQWPLQAQTIEEAWADLQQLPLPWFSAADKQDELLNAPAVEFGSLDSEDESAEPPSNEEGVQQTSVMEFGPTPVEFSPTPSEIAEVDSPEAVAPEPAVQEAESLEAPETPPGTEDIVDSADQEEQAEPSFSSEVSGNLEVSGDSEVNCSEPCDAQACEQENGQANAQETQDSQSGFFAAFSEPSSDELPADFQLVQAETQPQETKVAESTEATPNLEEDPIVQDAQEGASLERPQFTVASEDEIAETSELVLPQDSYFEDKPTDERLLALEQEQEAFEEMQVWNPSEQSTASVAENIEETFTERETPSSEALFGADFDDEIQVEPNESRQPLAAALEPEDTELGYETYVASDTIVPVQNPASEVTESIAEQQAQLDVAPDTVAPDTALDASPWSIDVASTESGVEIELQTEIEDLISQLNFASFTEESFSVEQVSRPPGSQPLDSSAHQPARDPDAETVEDSVRFGKESEFHTMHRGTSDTAAEDLEQSPGSTNAPDALDGQDDDRDMLIVEEDVTQHPNRVEASAQRVAPYAQLFAKLRK